MPSVSPIKHPRSTNPMMGVQGIPNGGSHMKEHSGNASISWYMEPWSLPLVPDGVYGGDDDVEEPG
jgi:hypothetical protein